ncbi:TetR/AcrR family transcriptional regulator [Gryllotalpicola ginsengisoli]|uniref:TetR/AcrR family transcriptional regulator n=1 Tax=Gryllotalpicola ginsengisoli TaxID=444608 RepID=UPI000425553C|nr:TetR/AcrR family transcriptional regulator [Gryllotalpicola ginsengisoli]
MNATDTQAMTAMRRRILDAATEAFRLAGYNGATMVRVAALAGVTYAQLHAEFPNKEALLHEVLDRGGAGDDDLPDPDSVQDPCRALEAMVGLVDYNTAHRSAVELFTVLVGEAATNPEHPAHGYFAERYRQRLDVVTRTYRRAHDAGVLRPGCDPATAAGELLALIDGLRTQWLLLGSAVDMGAVVRAHLSRQLVEPHA